MSPVTYLSATFCRLPTTIATRSLIGCTGTSVYRRKVIRISLFDRQLKAWIALRVSLRSSRSIIRPRFCAKWADEALTRRLGRFNRSMRSCFNCIYPRNSMANRWMNMWFELALRMGSLVVLFVENPQVIKIRCK